MDQAAPVKLTRDTCREYLYEKTFQLRPAYYSARYPIWPGSVGLEVEMLPLRGKDVSSLVPLLDSTREFEALAPTLLDIGKLKGWRANQSASPDSPVTMIHLEAGDNLSFEPGGQLEHSTVPYPCLSDAMRRVKKIQWFLDQKLEGRGISLRHFGINPYHSVEDIGLQMNKPRYQAMNAYFSSIGEWGPRMMRQTCTVQVCLDFGENESVLGRRYLVSELVAPFSQAMFANSPFIDGKLTDIDGVRAKTWKHLDKTRTGLMSELIGHYASASTPDVVGKEKCVEFYLNFLLKSQVVFIESLNYEVPSSGLTFAEWIENGYKNLYPSEKDLDTQLSLLFPEVRPKGFLELRAADAQDRAWQFVPAAFFTGLLYDEKATSSFLEYIAPHLNYIGALYEKTELGLEDEQLATHCQRISEIALEGFSRLPSCFREEGMLKTFQAYLERFTSQKRTPAREVRETLQKLGKDSLDDSTWKGLSSAWSDLVGT